jgi:hypothetical protein
MPTHRHLSHDDQQTLEHLFGAHGAHHIEWVDLVRLIEGSGSVVEEKDGDYKFIVNGEHHTFARPRHDRITDAEEIAGLRAFLKRARLTP